MTILSVMTDDAGRRLDRVLRKALPDIPLSRIHRLLREGRVLVDKQPQEAAFRVRTGQEIAVPVNPLQNGTQTMQTAGRHEPGPRAKTPRGVPLILYEDPDLLAVNKEAGVPVHGTGGSLDSLVQAYLDPKLPPSLSFRPGPLHRLDRPTSGIVVFSVSLSGARHFSALLQEGKIHKQYLALVEGRIDDSGSWEEPLLRDRENRRTIASADGKPARTAYSPLTWYPGGKKGDAGKPGDGYTLLLLEPETGRRHQIRSHAAIHGHPLAGDSSYGGRPLPNPPPPGEAQGPPFLLHAWKLLAPALLPPLEAPVPEYFWRQIPIGKFPDL
ncbi:MAG: RluA family pseudouridine synthase [Treponema sp.]|jgi:23S rRNA pseudouridine955/2504/2580 synthase|nr:RluA family pseudouridine synthase [Treponema sp.]